jgi:hypothetical protein
MALNTILSHPEQNSYVTVAEANDYLLTKQGYDAWAALSTAKKEAFLKQAALQMNEIRYKAYEVYDRDKDYRKSQNLAFPRVDYNSYIMAMLPQQLLPLFQSYSYPINNI